MYYSDSSLGLGTLETMRTPYAKVLWQKGVYLSTRPKRGPAWLESWRVNERNGVRCTLVSKHTGPLYPMLRKLVFSEEQEEAIEGV